MLSWQLQCAETKRKAMRVVGILQRNLSAVVAFHLCLLIWTGLHCSNGAGYVISACFIRYAEVKSMSPFPMTLPPCLHTTVKGRVTTFRSGSLPLQSMLTNTLSMWDQPLHGTHYQLMLLVRPLTQNLSEECPLLKHINLITSFIFIPCNSIPCKCFSVISYHVFEWPLATPLLD